MESIGSLLGTSSCDTMELLQCTKALMEVRGVAMSEVRGGVMVEVRGGVLKNVGVLHVGGGSDMSE